MQILTFARCTHKIKEFLSNKQTAPFIRQKLFFILSIKNIVHNKRGYRTIDFPPRSAKLILLNSAITRPTPRTATTVPIPTPISL